MWWCRCSKDRPLPSKFSYYVKLNWFISAFKIRITLYIWQQRINLSLLSSIYHYDGTRRFALLLSYGQCGLLTQQLLMPTLPSGCYYRGSFYPFGWFSTHPCESCQCSTSGQVMCMFNDCWQPAYADPVQEKDYCCPTCPNGKYQTYLHVHDRGALQELYSI